MFWLIFNSTTVFQLIFEMPSESTLFKQMIIFDIFACLKLKIEFMADLCHATQLSCRPLELECGNVI